MALGGFFVWVAGFCLVLVVAGFTPTYFRPIARGAGTEFAPAVHLHGSLFFGWVMLLLVQTSLVGRGQTAAHRSLGLAGIALATAMVLFGFLVSLAAGAERMALGQVDRAYDLGFSNTVALVGFAVMFTVAVVKRRDPAAHKRLMVFATCMILTPAVGRLYRPLFAPAPPAPLIVFLTIDVILIACLVYDVRTMRRPHPVTLVCGTVLVAFQILRFQLPTMSWWRVTYDHMLQGFARSVGA